MNSGMILENTIPPFSIGNHFWYVTMYDTYQHILKINILLAAFRKFLSIGIDSNIFSAISELFTKVVPGINPSEDITHV